MLLCLASFIPFLVSWVISPWNEVGCWTIPEEYCRPLKEANLPSEGTLLWSRSWVPITAVSFAHWEDNRATRKTQNPQSRDGSWGLCISPSFWEALWVLRSACQGAYLCSVFAERAQFICSHPMRYSDKQVAQWRSHSWWNSLLKSDSKTDLVGTCLVFEKQLLKAVFRAW